jgi:hypothetical protein
MTQYSLTSATATFKTKYDKLLDMNYNAENPLWARLKKNYNFVGEDLVIANALGFAGGVGSGVLPTANAANYQRARLTAKKVYAVAQIDRESIKASANDEGAFVQGLKEVTKKQQESYMRNASRIIYADGSGILGRGDGATNVSGAGSVASPYVVTFGSSFKEANFEEKDFVQIVTGMAALPSNLGGVMENTLLEIVLVNASLRQVSLVGTSATLAGLTGANPLPTTAGVAMQGSYLLDPTGLDKIIVNPGASLYTITTQRRWSATVIAAAGAGLSVPLMNRLVIQMIKKCGKSPNLIVASFEQYTKFLDLQEDQKRYMVIEPRMKELIGKVSFTGVEYMSPNGPIPVIMDRFLEADRMYFLNDNFLEIHHRPDFGIFTDDGTAFLRVSGQDSYESRYGGYWEFFGDPNFQGALTGLAV